MSNGNVRFQCVGIDSGAPLSGCASRPGVEPIVSRIHHHATRGTRRFGSRGVTTLVGVILSLLVIRPAIAGTAVVVLSSNAAQYLEAEQAVAEAMAARGHVVQLLCLQSATHEGLKPYLKPGIATFIAIGAEAAVALRANLPDEFPMTFCMVADAEGLQLTAERRAHGAAAAVSFPLQVKLIAETLPEARLIGAIYRGQSHASMQRMRRMREALPEGWRLEAIDIDASHSVAAAIDNLFARGVDVVWAAADAAVYDVATMRAVLLASVRYRTPVFGHSQAFAQAGALFCVEIDPAVQGRQAAEIAMCLLAGESLDAPKLTEHIEITLNLTVAQMLSIAFPEALLKRADRIIHTDQTR